MKIGTDNVSIERKAKSVEKSGDRFLHRLLSASEKEMA